jgi:hypothetical protein
MRGLNLSNACCHLLQDILFPLLLSKKKVKIKIYKTAILDIGLIGCEILWLILREEHRLRVFDNCRGEYLDIRGMKLQKMGKIPR